jgi:hypothetical protein
VQLAILHLSDVHLASIRDVVLTRSKQICGALHEAAPNAKACIVLVSGDIPFSGKQAEYEIAYSFFDQLKSELLELPVLQTVAFLAVPGNHDCDFEGESDVR